MTFSTKKRGRAKVVKAVDNVSFDVMKGEVFGLVGESGCGKTTTGRTIIRLYNPLSGEVKYNGRVISGKLDKDTHKYITDNIAMIFQDPIASLNPRMTVAEIVGEGLKIRGMNDLNERNAKVIEMLGGGAGPRARHPLPPRVLRRPAAAHRHRPCSGRQPHHADRRRACFRSGRFGPGPGHQPDQRSEG